MTLLSDSGIRLSPLINLTRDLGIVQRRQIHQVRNVLVVRRRFSSSASGRGDRLLRQLGERDRETRGERLHCRGFEPADVIPPIQMQQAGSAIHPKLEGMAQSREASREPASPCPCRTGQARRPTAARGSCRRTRRRCPAPVRRRVAARSARRRTAATRGRCRSAGPPRACGEHRPTPPSHVAFSPSVQASGTG